MFKIVFVYDNWGSREFRKLDVVDVLIHLATWMRHPMHDGKKVESVTLLRADDPRDPR